MNEEKLKLLLSEQGFENFNRLGNPKYGYSSLHVYSSSFEEEKRILKSPSYDFSDIILYNKELKGLKRLNGLKNITSLIDEINFDLHKIDSSLPKEKNLLPFVLVKKYARGSNFLNQYLSTEHQQQVIDLINEIHKKDFVDLDIRGNNFIYFPGKPLVFVDIFHEETLDTFEFKNNREIQRLKKADLESLEIMLSN